MPYTSRSYRRRSTRTYRRKPYRSYARKPAGTMMMKKNSYSRIPRAITSDAGYLGRVKWEAYLNTVQGGAAFCAVHWLATGSSAND